MNARIILAIFSIFAALTVGAMVNSFIQDSVDELECGFQSRTTVTTTETCN